MIGSLTGSPIGVTTSNTPNKDNRYCTYFDFAKASSADLLVKNKFAYENDSAIYIGTYTNNGITYLRACAHKDSSFRYEKPVASTGRNVAIVDTKEQKPTISIVRKK